MIISPKFLISNKYFLTITFFFFLNLRRKKNKVYDLLQCVLFLVSTFSIYSNVTIFTVGIYTGNTNVILSLWLHTYLHFNILCTYCVNVSGNGRAIYFPISPIFHFRYYLQFY